MISPETIELVRQSYGRCVSKGNFIEDFYHRFLNADPAIPKKFEHTDFDQQYHLLKHGLNLVIMFAADSPAGKKGLLRIRDTHRKTRLDIAPELYPIWKEALLATIGTHDREYNDLIGKAWKEVLDYGIGYISAGYLS